MLKQTSFATVIDDVQVDVEASIYDGEIDEFTVYAGGVIITEILRDDVVETLRGEALDSVSKESIDRMIADDNWKNRGE